MEANDRWRITGQLPGGAVPPQAPRNEAPSSAELIQAYAEIARLRTELDTLRASRDEQPPTYTLLLAVHADGTVDVFAGGQPKRVKLSGQALDVDFKVGDEVLIDNEFRVVGRASRPQVGEVAIFAHLIDNEYAVVRLGLRDEVMAIAGSVDAAGLLPGDGLLVRPDARLVLARLNFGTLTDSIAPVGARSFADVAGLSAHINRIRTALDVGTHLASDGVGLARRMATILLHGPSGCGKSLLAEATVNAFVERASGATAVRVRMTALLSKYVGESEGGLQLIFKRARELALRHGRHALIIEDVDMVATGKGSPLAKQLAAEIDDLPAGNTLLVVFTTNRLDLVPAELTSPSRVDITMLVDRPDAVAAREILHRRLAKAPWSLDEAGAAVDAAVERLYASGEFRQAASAAALSRVTRVAARRAAFRAAKTCELLRLTADDLLAAAAAEIEAIRH